MKSIVLIEKYIPRTCSKCSNVFPKTRDFFSMYKNKSGYTYRFQCVGCHNKKIQEWFNNNKEYRKGYYKNYCSNNKDTINKTKRNYKAIRKESDPLYKLTINIRNSILTAIKKKNFTKKSKTYEILGCSFEEFKIHIESKFLPWMNWNNHGKYNCEFNYGWDYDHIISINTATTEEELLKLNHYTNFQPLCSKVNRDIKR